MLRAFCRPMLGKLALLVGSVLFTLLVFEAGIRLELVKPWDHVVSDAWWKEHWLRDREGGNPREFVELDPLLGWIPAAGLDGLEYEGVRIHTTSAHARGRSEVPRERTGKPRLVAVGDSYTFGQCVGDEETFIAVAGERLDAETVNLGVMGYGQGQALLRMRRDGLPYRPDFVVFGFHPSNVRRNPLRFRDYAKPGFRLTEGAGLELENVPVPPPQRFDRLWPPRLWNFVVMARDAVRYRQREYREGMNALSRAIVEQMAEEARVTGHPLVLVWLPHPVHLGNDGPFGWRWIAELCAEADPEALVCVDPVPRLRSLLPPGEARKEAFACHYSAPVQRAIGEALAERLRALRPELFAGAG